MEPVFQRLYSYIFDTDNAAISAVEMDRQVPSAIFVVNFDKVWPASGSKLFVSLCPQVSHLVSCSLYHTSIFEDYFYELIIKPNFSHSLSSLAQLY